MTTNAFKETNGGRWSKLVSFMLHELREVIPPTLFFFIAFNLILLTKRLILEDYRIEYTGFMIATVSALIVGKVVLVVDPMPFLRRFDHLPLAYPILFKAAVYTLFFFVVRLIEPFVHYLINGGAIGHGGFIEEMLGTFSWARFISVQMWVFVLFLVFIAANELNRLFGDGELYRMFFIFRPVELQAVPRAANAQ